MFHNNRVFQVRIIPPSALGRQVKARQFDLLAGLLAGNQLWVNDSTTASPDRHQEFAVLLFPAEMLASLKNHKYVTVMAQQIESITVTNTSPAEIQDIYNAIAKNPEDVDYGYYELTLELYRE